MADHTQNRCLTTLKGVLLILPLFLGGCTLTTIQSESSLPQKEPTEPAIQLVEKEASPEIKFVVAKPQSEEELATTTVSAHPDVDNKEEPFSIATLFTSSFWNPPPKKQTPETLALAEPPVYQDVWERIRAGMKLPKLNSPYLQHQEQWYAKRPDYVLRLTERARRYLFHIVEEVERRNMPMEIALLPAIESAFRPSAYSRARAAGLWQFIPSTGRKFGLKQNWWYEGRRDVVAATDAALNYLEYLHKLFKGDWFLALASYNAGETRVGRAVRYNRKHGRLATYEHLKLASETKNYIPKLVAFSKIIADPDSFGITLATIPNEPYFKSVDVGSQIDLGIAATMTGIQHKELSALNPAFRRWATDPTGPHHLLLPVAQADKMETALKALPMSKRMRWARHKIRGGESLSVIARQYNIPINSIKSANRLTSDLIREGKHLLIPLSGQRYATTAMLNNQAPPIKISQPITYKVHRGDSLWKIARRYGSSIESIKKANNLTKTLIKPGMRLTIPAKSDTRQTAKKSSQPTLTKQTHKVRRGDSLWKIAKKYRVQIAQLTKWNRINKKALLMPGQKLVVYTR
jgi:membrane-bound lytic murein transglycosylase D|tara:strand:+ start:2852 stop:4582 length:1731 start_codon:yes stop_codon:yes gene_type:complete